MAFKHEKIGIMGGTFNPIHLGHLKIAKEALRQYKLDKIWFMPNKIPAYKSTHDIIDKKYRIEMVKLAIENNPRFELSTFEMNREGFTYTCDTLELLTNENKEHEYYFIMGADSLVSFNHWKNPHSVAKNCTILAACRDDINDKEVDKYIYSLKEEFSAIIYKIKNVHIDVSSQMIREMIKSNKDVSNLLPKKVHNYILENNLYN